MTQDKDRAGFEAHWYNFYHMGSISAQGDGTYFNNSVQIAWEAWQAALEYARRPGAETRMDTVLEGGDEIALPPLPYSRPIDNGYGKREMQAYARQAITHDRQQRGEPIELQGVAEALKSGDGFWRECSGCHESNEGHPTGPYSKTMKCHLGVGCSECGGIGAIWDDTDYNAMADAMFGAIAAPHHAAPVRHPSYAPDCCQGHKSENECKCAAHDAEPSIKKQINDEWAQKLGSAAQPAEPVSVPSDDDIIDTAS